MLNAPYVSALKEPRQSEVHLPCKAKKTCYLYRTTGPMALLSPSSVCAHWYEERQPCPTKIYNVKPSIFVSFASFCFVLYARRRHTDTRAQPESDVLPSFVWMFLSVRAVTLSQTHVVHLRRMWAVFIEVLSLVYQPGIWMVLVGDNERTGLSCSK